MDFRLVCHEKKCSAHRPKNLEMRKHRGAIILVS